MRTLPYSAGIGAIALALMLVMSGTSYGQAMPSSTATIEVSVPADAKVWFDDSPTAQTGSERSFESPPLKPGQTYSYVVTAQWRSPDGKDVVRRMQASVRANEISNVEFVPRPVYVPASFYPAGYTGSYNGGGRGGLFSGYYRVGNVIINGRRWGDIGYRYSHADLIRW